MDQQLKGATAGRNQIDSLQILRGIAAVSVVLGHAIRAVVRGPDNVPLSNLSPWQSDAVGLLGTGVDLFFILSGFLMVHISAPYVSSAKTKWDFLASRLIKIWPIYVVSTLIVLALAVARARGAPIFDLQPARLLSFVFIPSFNEKGGLAPILGVGWTLNYEMFFYLMFTIVLGFARNRLLVGLSTVLMAAFAVGSISPSGSILNAFLGNPILFEFLAGAAIARLYGMGLLNRLIPAHSIAIGLIMLVALASVDNEGYWRFIARGVPSVFFFVGFLLYGNEVKWSKPALFIGDASYSIYLIHIPFVYKFADWADRLGPDFGPAPSPWFTVPMITCAAVAGGSAYYIIVERPLFRFCKSKYNQWKYGRGSIRKSVSDAYKQ